MTQTATLEQHGSKTHLDKTTKRRIIIASMVGTTIEFYDFYAYATAAVAVFPYLFFPKNEDPTIGLLSSFATFGLAFVARPLGSIIFGHFGDRIGRKATLVGSLLTMGDRHLLNRYTAYLRHGWHFSPCPFGTNAFLPRLRARR